MAPRLSHPTSPYRPLPVRHLPLLRHLADDLEIPAIIDQFLPPDPRNKVSEGDCVLVMLLNILAGKVALYDMNTWLSDTDAELLLGTGVNPAHFHDDRLGRCLDRLFDAPPNFCYPRSFAVFSYALNSGPPTPCTSIPSP